MTYSRLAVLTVCAIGISAGTSGHLAAADLGSSCCADLEERIAELEGTVVRKGNRKVSLTVSGQVNQAVLIWDDGGERNTYVVGNKNDQSNFSFSGDAQISKDVKVGYQITVRLEDNLSDGVSQDADDSGLGFTVWESFWFVESERLGRLALGQTSRVSDTAPEQDLSETGSAAYAGVQDLGGGFFVRRTDGTLSAITLGDLVNHFNGDTANVIRYDTPSWRGFVASASWGEDDIWDVGVKFDGEGGGFKIAAAIAYTQDRDENGLDGAGGDPSDTLLGSFAVLHEATGLNALISAGERDFEDAGLGTARFAYGKIGWIAKLTAVGPTAFYGEYGRFTDFALGAEFDPTAAPGVGIAGSSTDVWGFGVVQHVEAADMQLYLGYRNRSFDLDLDDGSKPAVDDLQTVVVGSKIAF
jgi:hypothetical protein